MNLAKPANVVRTLESIPRLKVQLLHPYLRSYCSSTTIVSRRTPSKSPTEASTKGTASLPALSVMPTGLLLRSYFITSILASPRILKICLPMLNKIANSESAMLNPDRNPMLHLLLRKLIYDHFAAGEKESEVRRSIAAMKKLGFNGIILGYAKEFNLNGRTKKEKFTSVSAVDRSEVLIQAWKDGTLETLKLIGEGDFLAVKFSGAGPSAVEALALHKPPPAKVWEAIEQVCQAAAKQNTRIWIDAEQQKLQTAIDVWTIELMRKYNQGEKALIYTTMQAYLKQTPDNILQHLKLAGREGWILGIKLVRGAYIATESRKLIHNTIDDTHNAYNSIAENLLRGKYPGIPSNTAYPRVALFLATHNSESIKKAYAVQKSLIIAGKPTLELGYGQLQGMADEVSCGLLQLCHSLQSGEEIFTDLAPKAFKCMSWGTTQECLQFLLRRVKENNDALNRTNAWVVGFRQELWRRIKVL